MRNREQVVEAMRLVESAIKAYTTPPTAKNYRKIREQASADRQRLLLGLKKDMFRQDVASLELCESGWAHIDASRRDSLDELYIKYKRGRKLVAQSMRLPIQKLNAL